MKQSLKFRGKNVCIVDILDLKTYILLFNLLFSLRIQTMSVRVFLCAVLCLDSRRRPRLLDCREHRSSVERWIPEAELVLRFRLT